MIPELTPEQRHEEAMAVLREHHIKPSDVERIDRERQDAFRAFMAGAKEEPGTPDTQQPREWPEELADNDGAQPAAPNTRAAEKIPNGAIKTPPKVLTVEQILAVKRSKPKMLIESLIPIPGAVLISGPQKSGKTVLAVQAAIAVASGRPLMDNFRIIEPGPVLFIEQDDPAGAASIQEYLNASLTPVKGIPFHLVEHVPYTFGPEFLSWLQSQITALECKFIVLDSYTALRPHRRAGGDIVKVEYDELAMLDVLAKRNNCTILVLTHDSKAAKSSRGLDWSDLQGGTFATGMAVEGQLHICRFPDSDSNALERLVHMRCRHGKGNELAVCFREETLDYRILIEGAAAPFLPVIRQIQNTFKSQSFTPKDLCFETGMSRASAHRCLAPLLNTDILTRRETGVYALREAV